MAIEKKEFIKSIEELDKNAKKRKFKQTVDLIVNLKNIDLKKPDEKINTFLTLPKGLGKKVKICALVDVSLFNEAKKHCYVAIQKEQFQEYAKESKKLKKLANECDYFIGQANLMPDIANAFGRVLGSRGKMPNPKAGCIIPPKGNFEPIVKKLQNMIKIQTKSEPVIKCRIGTEGMSKEDIAENAYAVYDHLLHILKQGDNNINQILVKYTMSKPVIIGGEKNE